MLDQFRNLRKIFQKENKKELENNFFVKKISKKYGNCSNIFLFFFLKIKINIV